MSENKFGVFVDFFNVILKHIVSTQQTFHEWQTKQVQTNGCGSCPISWIPRNSPGQNPGVGSLSLLQGIFPTQGSNEDPLHCRQILYWLSYPSSGVLPTKPQDVALLSVPGDLSAITKSHVPLPSKLSVIYIRKKCISTIIQWEVSLTYLSLHPSISLYWRWWWQDSICYIKYTGLSLYISFQVAFYKGFLTYSV